MGLKFPSDLTAQSSDRAKNRSQTLSQSGLVCSAISCRFTRRGRNTWGLGGRERVKKKYGIN